MGRYALAGPSTWRSSPAAQLRSLAHTETTWKMLQKAIHEINNHNESLLSFEELYRCGGAGGSVVYASTITNTGTPCPTLLCGKYTFITTNLRNGYNMVINKFGDRLYSGLEETQRQHLRNVALLISNAQGGEGLLRELKLRWDNHNKSMQMIRDVLMVCWMVLMKRVGQECMLWAHTQTTTSP